MTRLTQEQIATAFNERMFPRFASWHSYSERTQVAIVEFAETLAALAVQEVERGVDPCYKQESEMAWAALGQDVSRAFNPSELGSEILKLRAALAEVTKWLTASRQRRDELVAQLATAKREEQERIIAEVKDLRSIYTNIPESDYAVGWHEACDAMLRKFPPATPSGEGTEWPCARCAARKSETCPDCTPSPEAREVPEVVDLKVEVFLDGLDWESRFQGVRITPADAKRIVAMGTE